VAVFAARDAVAHWLHEAVDERGRQRRAGGGLDASGRDEPSSQSLFKARLPKATLLGRFHRGQRTGHAAVDVGHGDCLHVGRAQVGEVTSSMRSPLLGKNIALARVDVAHGEVGTQLEVSKLDGQQKRLPAVIVPLSHYDPKKTRPQS